MKFLKKVSSVLCAITLLIFMLDFPVYAQGTSDGDSLLSSQQVRNETIQSLIDERVYLEIEEPNNTEELKKIDEQLVDLGVDFLNDQEIESLLCKNIGSNVIPYANFPATSDTNTWMSYRTSNVSYGGKKYNVQTIVVNPKSASSKLADVSTASITYPSVNWQAGAVNLIKSAAVSIGGQVSGTFPAVVTLYDALNSAISGLNTTSIVKLPLVTYSWDLRTSVIFEYVKPEGESDSSQILTFIRSKVIGNLVTVIPSLSYKRTSSTGAWENFGQTVTESRVYLDPTPTITAHPAIYGYVNGTLVRDCISKYSIYGPEDKQNTDMNISICVPNYPLQCE